MAKEKAQKTIEQIEEDLNKFKSDLEHALITKNNRKIKKSIESISQIDSEELKAERDNILKKAVMSNSSIFSLIPSSISKSFIKDTLEKYGYKKDGQVSEIVFSKFYNGLSKEQKQNNEFTDVLLSINPKFFTYKDFKKTQENSFVALEHGLFNEIPDKFRSKELLEKALSAPINKNDGYIVFKNFSLLSKKDKKSEFCTQQVLNFVLKHENYNYLTSTHNYVNSPELNKFLDSANEKIIHSQIDEIINFYPNVLFRNNSLKDIYETNFALFVPKNRRDELLDKAFDISMKASFEKFSLFVGKIPVNSLDKNTLLKFANKCLVKDKFKADYISYLREFVNALKSSKKLEQVDCASLLNEVVAVDPHILGELEESHRDKILKTKLGQKIICKAISKDPTALKYVKEPLTKAQQVGILQGCIDNINNFSLSKELRKQFEDLFLGLIGSKHNVMINDNYLDQVNISNLDMKKILGQLTQQNPEILIECALNPEIAAMSSFNKILKEAMKLHNQDKLIDSLKDKLVDYNYDPAFKSNIYSEKNKAKDLEFCNFNIEASAIEIKRYADALNLLEELEVLVKKEEYKNIVKNLPVRRQYKTKEIAKLNDEFFEKYDAIIGKLEDKYCRFDDGFSLKDLENKKLEMREWKIKYENKLDNWEKSKNHVANTKTYTKEDIDKALSCLNETIKKIEGNYKFKDFVDKCIKTTKNIVNNGKDLVNNLKNKKVNQEKEQEQELQQ